jgi:hypothetical protein
MPSIQIKAIHFYSSQLSSDFQIMKQIIPSSKSTLSKVQSFNLFLSCNCYSTNCNEILQKVFFVKLFDSDISSKSVFLFPALFPVYDYFSSLIEFVKYFLSFSFYVPFSLLSQSSFRKLKLMVIFQK